MSTSTNRRYRITRKTEIAVGIDNGIKWHSFAKNTSDVCSDYKGPWIFVEHKPFWRSLKRMKKRGVKSRFITDIRKENLVYCKKLLEIGEIGHIEAFNGNWGILDGIHYLGPALSQHADPIAPILIRISIKDFVDSHQDLFNSLWNKAIPIEQRIKEIEKGIIPAKIETISEPAEIETKYINLLENATKEILLIFPTLNSMRHQFHIGIFKVLKKNIEQHDKLKIRILFPYSILSSSLSNESLKEKTDREYEYELKNINIYRNNVSIKNIEPSISTKSIIIVVDRKESLVVEIKNDLKEKFSESMGFGTYSNSAATVISYVSIFESFWSYSDIVEKLKRSEELQKDFIQIAAHELRTPIQPILGFSNLLTKIKPEDTNEFQNLAIIINRNAKKLIQLTNDILDVTKIETNNLVLDREEFNLIDMIQDLIQDYDDQIDHKNIKLSSKFMRSNKYDEKGEIYENKNRYNHISLFADRIRINQVISALLHN